jgi:hypothetical protein
MRLAVLSDCGFGLACIGPRCSHGRAQVNRAPDATQSEWGVSGHDY